ncbi:hypothetical protein Tcan_01896 [Toxocara canis]|uniref:Uncharacterized protein n=1 Tax=Toxocara canis TaxID=6265 RepID=A0A0B2VVF1_TOXCA|nr:hypothetical protein Tcan_01896 [Toxocara canis]
MCMLVTALPTFRQTAIVRAFTANADTIETAEILPLNRTATPEISTTFTFSTPDSQTRIMKFTLLLLIATLPYLVVSVPVPDPSLFLSSFNNIGGLMNLASNNHNRNTGNTPPTRGVAVRRTRQRGSYRDFLPILLMSMAKALQEEENSQYLRTDEKSILTN